MTTHRENLFTYSFIQLIQWFTNSQGKYLDPKMHFARPFHRLPNEPDKGISIALNEGSKPPCTLHWDRSSVKPVFRRHYTRKDCPFAVQT